MTRERIRREVGTGWFVAAAVGGMVHAAVSLYWLLGGTWLVETLGSRIVQMFSGRLFMLTPVVAIKVALALGPWWLQRSGWPSRRLTRTLSWLVAAAFLAWGGLNVIVGNAVLWGWIRPEDGYDRAAMIGHAWLWDPLFVIWGAALAGGLWITQREPRAVR